MDKKEMIKQDYQEGNIVVNTIEGTMVYKMDEFVKQPLAGILYDINRDESTIMAFMDDPKWVNDLALTKLLEYYYNLSKRLQNENDRLNGITTDIPQP